MLFKLNLYKYKINKKNFYINLVDENIENITFFEDNKQAKKNQQDWRSNVGYGLMNIYLEEAGIDYSYCPDVNMLHGLFIGMTDKWYLNSEINFKSVSTLIVHNDDDKKYYERLIGNYKDIVVCAHPYHYIIDRYIEKNKNLITRSGSVFFLPHSLGQPIPLVPIEYTLKKLNELEDKFHPIEICIHQSDYSKQIVEKINSFGFRIRSCGSRYDSKFLHRFYQICSDKKYSINLNMGTQTWLSVLSGCEIFMLHNIPMLMLMPSTTNWNIFQAIRPYYWRIIDQLENKNLDQKLLYNYIYEATGGNYKKNNDELFNIFETAAMNNIKFINKQGNFIIPRHLIKHFEFIYIQLKKYTIAMLNRLRVDRKQLKMVVVDAAMHITRYERAKLDNNEFNKTIINN